MNSKETISLEYRTKWLNLLREIVLKYVEKDKYAVFLYGSAVKNLQRAHDFDIGILGGEEFSYKTRYKIQDEIEESIIPFDVDIVDFLKVREEFKKIALKEIEIWNKPKNIEIN